uniref:Uncharacterized protein n=1 Tax=Arundo donax TaxID=35708 RepID=A0A0A9FCU6_ARUDO
MISLSGPGWVF